MFSVPYFHVPVMCLCLYLNTVSFHYSFSSTIAVEIFSFSVPPMLFSVAVVTGSVITSRCIVVADFSSIMSGNWAGYPDLGH